MRQVEQCVELTVGQRERLRCLCFIEPDAVLEHLRARYVEDLCH